MTKKTIRPTQGEAAALPKARPLPPRQHRALTALMQQPRIACKDLSAIAGANNYAELVAGIRRRFGFDAITTQEITVQDRDGRKCAAGAYSIAPHARAAIAAALQEGTRNHD